MISPPWALVGSLLGQGPSGGEVELEEQPLHAALGTMALEGVVVDLIGVPRIPHWPTPELTRRQFLYTSWGPVFLCIGLFSGLRGKLDLLESYHPQSNSQMMSW